MGPARASPGLLGLINSLKATQRPPGTQLTAWLAESSHRGAPFWHTRVQGGKAHGARYQPYKPTRNSQTTPAPSAQPPAHTARQYCPAKLWQPPKSTESSNGGSGRRKHHHRGLPWVAAGTIPPRKPPAPSASGRIYRAVPVTHRLSNCRMAVVKNPICQRIRILLALPAEK